MVDAVGDPDTLRVLEQRLKLACFAIAGIVLDDLLERAPNSEVIAVLLIVNDVATREPCLR